jgi:hypothetical protein
MVVVDQDKQDSMMAKKNLYNPMGSEHYKTGDFLSHKEDKHFSLEEGKK